MKECKEVENEVRISLDLTEVKLGFDHLKNIYWVLLFVNDVLCCLIADWSWGNRTYL